MTGVIFYDESDGPVPLKSSISPYGVVNLSFLDCSIIKIINEILDLDMDEYPVFCQNENLMRRISKLFWYVDPRRKKISSTTTMYRRPVEEYSDFIKKNQPYDVPIWYIGDQGFWIYPSSFLIRGRSFLKSLISLWLSLDGIPPKNIQIVSEEETIIYNDKKNKIIYTLFKLYGNSDVVCLKVDTDNVFARTFEVKHDDILYYAVALRYNDSTSTNIKLLRYPEWDVELAYSTLFDGITYKPDTLITVKLKIE